MTTRPSISALVSQVETDMASRLGLPSLVPRGFLPTFARSIAGGLHGVYGQLEFNRKQAVPSTATGEDLANWATTFGIFRKPATYAKGSVTFTGVVGSTIPAGTRVKRSDGVEYAVDTTASFVIGTLTLACTARTVGFGANASAGTAVNLLSPIAGVQSAAVVAAGGFSGGTAIETDAALKIRLLFRIQNPPAGGSPADYVRWATSVSGVTRAWCLPEHHTIGGVSVAILSDDDPAGPLPSAGTIAAVQAVIDEFGPAGVAKLAFAPTLLTITPEIANLSPDTAATRTSAESAMVALLLREGAPGTPVLLTHFSAAISRAPGVEDFDLLVPAADVTVAAGEVPVLGTPIWT